MPIVDTPTLSNAQIGKCGELLVQYHLLKRGIESAPMTTDAGIDLVAYFPESARPVTIQVKTNLQPTPGGGRGKMALGWWVSETSPAEWVALVNLETQRIWLILHRDLSAIAHQRSSGRLHLYFYTDPQADPRLGNRLARDFDRYLFDQQIEKLLVPLI